MGLLDDLFDNNRKWAGEIKSEDPDFFLKLGKQQAPEYLWIGCSDSRVPANEIVGLLPGELFVHRNVGNVVIQSDLNCLSVLQFAVEVLRVKHIIVTGHYGCGGVKVAMENRELGLIDNWLRSIKDVYVKHEGQLSELQGQARIDRLCELNVVEQVANVCQTTVMQRAWRKGQQVAVHGCIYGITDGILRDLNVTVTGADQVPPIYHFDKE